MAHTTERTGPVPHRRDGACVAPTGGLTDWIPAAISVPSASTTIRRRPVGTGGVRRPSRPRSTRPFIARSSRAAVSTGPGHGQPTAGHHSPGEKDD